MFRTIVVGTDGSRTADRAMRKATDLARLCSARLHVVTAYRLQADMTVIGPMGIALGADDEKVRSEVEAMLHGREKEISAEGVAVSVHAIPGRAVDAILAKK